MKLPIRDLAWDACVNVRDLGGHATEDGGETRFGAVVRSDNVERLSDAGWEAVIEYGVRTIVDLRLATERQMPVPDRLPLTPLHIPLLPEFGHPDWLEIDALARNAEPPDATRLIYLEFLERYRHAFGAAMTAIASAEETVLVHCQAGKDRTGLVIALLLRLAGVGIDAIAADYARSGVNLHQIHEKWIAQSEDDAERKRRVNISATPVEAMAGVLSEVEARYGSAQSFLASAGVSGLDLERLRQRLRT